MLRRLLLSVSLVLGGCVTPGEQPGTTLRPLAEADPAIFQLVARPADSTQLRAGTAFLVTPTVLVTARHSIEGIHDGRVLLTNAGRSPPLEGRVAWVAPDSVERTDVALIELSSPVLGVRPLTFAAPANVGQPVLAVGYPIRTESQTVLTMLVEGVPTPALPTSQRLGRVTADQMSRDGRWITASSTVSSGNSGGPLLDACGRVVGMVARMVPGAGSTIAQSAQVVFDELNRWRAGTASAIDTRPCTQQLPEAIPGDAPIAVGTLAPWPVPTWLPALQANAVRNLQPRLVVPGWVGSLAIDAREQSITSGSQTRDAASADRLVLEHCEFTSQAPCTLVSRTSGPVAVRPAPQPQPRLAQRSPTVVISELPFLNPTSAAWLSARFAEREPARTAIALEPQGSAFWNTSETASEATAHALAACRRALPQERRDQCFVVWDGVRTISGVFSQARNAEELRASLRAGRPLDGRETVLEDISADVMTRYLALEAPKALAVDPVTKHVVMFGRQDTLAEAGRLVLEHCEYRVGRPCRLYARNDVALLPAERTQPRPQARLQAPTLQDLPFVQASLVRSVLVPAANSYTAAGRKWTLTLHQSGHISISSADTQAEADRNALARCRDRNANDQPDHCQIAVRGDGRPGPALRSPTPIQPPRGS